MFRVIPADTGADFVTPPHQNVENNPMQSSQWLPA
jgi:hypothetical protein